MNKPNGEEESCGTPPHGNTTTEMGTKKAAGVSSTDSGEETDPEVNSTFYPFLRLHRKLSNSNPAINARPKLAGTEGKLRGVEDSGFLSSVESMESRDGPPDFTDSISSRKTSSPPALSGGERMTLRKNRTATDLESMDKTELIGQLSGGPSTGRERSASQEEEPLSGGLAVSKSASMLGRFFGFGRNQNLQTPPMLPEESDMEEEERKKSSITDMLFQRGVFAKGFEVTPEEINIFFNQK